jgi:hypothetical protein
VTACHLPCRRTALPSSRPSPTVAAASRLVRRDMCRSPTKSLPTFALMDHAPPHRTSSSGSRCRREIQAVAEWIVRRTGLTLRGAEWSDVEPAAGLIMEVQAYLGFTVRAWFQPPGAGRVPLC